MDAAIVFSDILVILDAMGAGGEYPPGGPRLKRPFSGEDDLERLQDVDVSSSLGYVADVVELLSTRIHPDRALIGFAGAPLTLAAYLVESRGSRDVRHFKALAYSNPDLMRRLLFGLADKVADRLRLQVEAGADLIQVFDSWASLLSPQDYADIALPAVRRVFSRPAWMLAHPALASVTQGPACPALAWLGSTLGGEHELARCPSSSVVRVGTCSASGWVLLAASTTYVAHDELYQLFGQPPVIEEVRAADSCFEGEGVHCALNDKGRDLDIQGSQLLGALPYDCTDEFCKGPLQFGKGA